MDTKKIIIDYEEYLNLQQKIERVSILENLLLQYYTSNKIDKKQIEQYLQINLGWKKENQKEN